MRRPLWWLPAALLALVVAAVPGVPPSSARAAGVATSAPIASAPVAVVEKRLLGRSVRGRPITAYRLGEPGKPVMMLISTMHGDEPATRHILRSLINGRKVRGIDLWVVPTYNPDGLVRHRRKNAHSVDLNRNYPYRWAPLNGSYESGPRPRSEPETRAMMAFLRDIRPRRILSFHQPLNGVDTDTKKPAFARRVGRALNLPAKAFTCGGVCHGTMTMWFNHRFPGTALTVEYGPHPSRKRMRVNAPRQVLRVLGGRR
jgi:protein MpaA